MTLLHYFLGMMSVIIPFIAFSLGGIWSFLPIFQVTIFIPIMDRLFQGTEYNLSQEEEAKALANKGYDYILWLTVPLQISLLCLYLYKMTEANLVWWEVAAMTIGMGLSFSVLAINSAHELGHRVTKHEQFMAKILLCTSLYMHFFIEHNRGHHKYVATEEDPSSAKYGENLYTFWVRSVTGAWLSAWKLEKRRLSRLEKPFISWQNEMLRFQVIQLVYLSAVALVCGLKVLLLLVIAAIMGILLLETANYIEHYGLRRKKIKEGIYEPTMPIHSWNSNHTYGRMLLFDLSRHSDHHYRASRKYQILRHFDDSPQLPAGYPSMLGLAFIPPLWFHVMHKQIEKYKASEAGKSLG